MVEHIAYGELAFIKTYFKFIESLNSRGEFTVIDINCKRGLPALKRKN